MACKKEVPPCPRCRSVADVVAQGASGYFACRRCGGLFDDDPDEGGDYCDRDPAARLIREERRQGREPAMSRPRSV